MWNASQVRIARANPKMPYRKGSASLLLAVAAFLALTAMPATAQDVGERVLVNWSKDAYSYPATIVEIGGGGYFVQFDDGDSEWTTRERIFAEDLRVGSRVFANWKRLGTYFPGIITRRVGDAIHVSYDDGDQEDTTISAVRVLR